MGGFLSASGWNFGGAADGWVVVIEVPLCFTLVTDVSGLVCR